MSAGTMLKGVTSSLLPRIVSWPAAVGASFVRSAVSGGLGIESDINAAKEYTLQLLKQQIEYQKWAQETNFLTNTSRTVHDVNMSVIRNTRIS